MAIGIHIHDRDISVLVDRIRTSLPGEKVYTELNHPEICNTISCLLCWGHYPDLFSRFPQLSWVSSLGAGVDHILQAPSFRESIMVTRIVDPSLTDMMSDYIINAIHKARDLISYSPTIGILGLGNIGRGVAEDLRQIGYQVIGYSRSVKDLPYPQIPYGNLTEFLSKVDILICLLPLTADTYHILNDKTIMQLRPGAYIINVGRHEHIDYGAMLEAIDSGHLAGACLDVYKNDDPHYKEINSSVNITVTPHIASITDQSVAAEQFVLNYHRWKMKDSLVHLVDIKRGY